MTDPDADVVQEVEASGLRTIVGAPRDEIAAALSELAARRNGTGPE